MRNFVTISGCSGGGKSTLLDELRRRGHHIVEEPGRRIVARELQSGGRALPWIDPVAFARSAIEMSLADRATAIGASSIVFFDRGLIDAATALQHLTGEPAIATLGAEHRCHRRVFLAPPWPEIFAIDAERRHDFGEAVAEFDRLTAAYASLGYELSLLPKTNVAERADFVLAALAYL